MDYEELLEYLNIEEPVEFEYFENFADLIECTEPISQAAIYKLVKGVPEGVFSELIEGYFNETLDACPDSEIQIYSLLETIKRALIGLSENLEDENDYVFFADEIARFRDWYLVDSKVSVQPKDSEIAKQMPLIDALAASRLEKLGGIENNYDFSEALDYPLDEFIMSIAPLSRKEEEYELEKEYELDNEEEYDDLEFEEKEI